MKYFKLHIWFVIIFISQTSFAADPGWEVNEFDYEQVMTLTAFLNVNGNRLASPNDRVAAFVGDQVRGVGSPIIEVNNENTFVATFLIFSNTPNELITFKIYDSINDVIVDVEQTLEFEIDANIGTRFQAFSLANPSLSNENDILQFGFSNVTEVKNVTFEGNTITVEINDFEDVTNLRPTYSISPGASMFLGSLPQNSDTEHVDFTNPIQYKVRSEDQSQLTLWTVNVITTPQEVARFFRRNAVCHLNGQIKVEFSIENEEVTLSGDGFTTQVQNIFEGFTTFVNIPPGTYTIMLSDIAREIEIEQN